VPRLQTKQFAKHVVVGIAKMKLASLLFVVLLTGCSTVVPVVAKFPDAPRLGLGTCPQLQTVKEGVKLSELTSTVTMNYSTYYECAVKADQWNEWYAIQKKIFEGVK
jgi:hypothetical protein